MDSDKQAERAWITMPDCVRQYVFDAVGKTVPAKPKNVYKFPRFGNMTPVTDSGCWAGRCPICDNTVYSTQYYCHQCGQRLEWEDLEEEKNVGNKE